MKNGTTPLHSAAYAGDSAVAEQLIVARCNFNLQTQSGCTPLHCAAGEGHVDVTNQLIAARSNVDLRDKNGGTALQVAELVGHAGIAMLIRNRKQETPLLGSRVVIN